jgi:hypothetical protein
LVFGSLHARRGEVIAELYGKLDDLDRAIHKLLSQHWVREIRVDVDRQHGLAREPSAMRPGYELLSASEQKDVDSLRDVTRDFYQFCGRNRIYFTPDVGALLDQVGELSFFFVSNYHNIAYMDKEGKPYVDPEVKRVWDGAVATIPKLKDLLDREFRSLLGVTPVSGREVA